MNEFNEELENSRSLADIFELVKEAVRKTTGRSRAGLMLGLADLGGDMSGFVGAFYPVDSNIIVVNKTPLKRISETNPELYNPYAFHILLHEYLHSFGVLDEDLVRKKTYEISRKMFGEKHITTELAVDMNKFLPDLVYPEQGWQPQEIPPIELVRDFAKSDTRYIT
jgi:hypothetical protein